MMMLIMMLLILLLLTLFIVMVVIMVIMEGILQKESAPGSRALPLVLFDKKVPSFPEIVLFYGIFGKSYTKSEIFERFQTLA